MKELAIQLRATPLFGPVPVIQLISLLEKSPIQMAEAGDIVLKPEEKRNNHLVLIEGEMEAQRTWSVQAGYDKSYTWILQSNDKGNGLAVLTAASRRLRARAITNIRYLEINADHVDELLGWSQQTTQMLAQDQKIKQRMSLVRQVGIFHHLAPEHVKTAFSRMQTMQVKAGETVFNEAEKGESYYLIEEGEAEVIRTDPFTDETRVVDQLGSGDSFGEVALIQRGYRTATIRMLTPGRLLELKAKDFKELIQPSMVSEISAEKIYDLMQDNEIKLLDCRWDLEFEESRIPGAKLVPLHLLHFQVNDLEPDARYIVYCHSGKRSRAAAFLLRERNFNVQSMIGGIRDWPYAIDASPL